MPHSHVYLVAGDDSFLRHEAIQKIRNTLPEKLIPLYFYSDEKTVKETLDACRSADMLAGGVLVIFKYIDNISGEDKDILSKYAQRPNSRAHLVVESSKKYAKYKDSYRKFTGFQVIECNRLKEGQLPARIYALAKRRNKGIEPPAVQCLMAKCGCDLGKLDEEIEKLALYIQQSRAITLQDVQELVGFDTADTVYDFTGAIFEKNAKKALGIAERVILNEADMIHLISLLSAQLERIARAKTMLKQKAQQREILGQLKIFSYRAEDFIKQVRASSAKSINQAANLIMEFDYDFKTKTGKHRNTFDTLIIKLCALK